MIYTFSVEMRYDITRLLFKDIWEDFNAAMKYNITRLVLQLKYDIHV